jgi:hypothetical protein
LPDLHVCSCENNSAAARAEGFGYPYRCLHLTFWGDPNWQAELSDDMIDEKQSARLFSEPLFCWQVAVT